MKSREYQSKFDSYFYNTQSNQDVKLRGIKLWQKSDFFPPLNVVSGGASYGNKGVLRNYHHRVLTKLVRVTIAVRRINCSCNYFPTHLSIPWENKIKDACIRKDIEEFSILSTIQLLDLLITGLLWILLMTEHMMLSINTQIK